MAMFRSTQPPGQAKKKSPQPDPAIPTSLIISPASLTLHTGTTEHATVTAYNYQGAPVLLPPDLTVQNSNVAAVTVVRTVGDLACTGTATNGLAAIKVHSATYNLTSNVLNADNAAIVIPPDTTPASIVVTPAGPLNLTAGQTQQLTAVVKNAAGDVLAGVVVGWVSSNAPAASVSGTGLVTAVAEGTANIKAVYAAIESNLVATTVAAAGGGPIEPDATLDEILAGLLDGCEFVFYDGVQPASGGTPAGYALGEATGLVPCGDAANLISPTVLPLEVSGLTAVRTGTPTWMRIVTAAGDFVQDVACSLAAITGKVEVPTFLQDSALSLDLTVEAVGGALRFTGNVVLGALRKTPELPRVTPNFDFLYTGYMDDAPVITMLPGENQRQAVQRGAVLMDPLVPKLRIKVPAGMTVAYAQNASHLPANPAGWILFEADVALPATTNGDVLGQRIYEAQAAALNLPWLVAPDFDSAIDFDAFARGYAFRGFRVKAESATPINQPFIGLGSYLANFPDTLQLNSFPSRISLRQICIVGDNPAGTGGHRRFGVQSLASMWEMVDCVVFHINFSGVDYSQQEQSFGSYEGLGKARVRNCAAWGATEPFAFGGAGHHAPFQAAQMLPTDITIQDTHFIRPYSMFHVEGSANMGECKSGRRFLIERTIHDYAPVDLQSGYGLVFWSADPNAPWTQFSDVTVRNCWFRDCNSGFALSNEFLFPTGGVPMSPRRALFSNILFTGLASPVTYDSPGSSLGRIISVMNHFQYATFEYITAVNGGVAVSTDTQTGDGQQYRGLVVRRCALQGYYFFINDGIGSGNLAWSQIAGPDCQFTQNLCSDSGGGANFPNPDGTNIAIAADGGDFGFRNGAKVWGSGTRASELDGATILGAHAGYGADGDLLKALLVPVEIPDAYRPV